MTTCSTVIRPLSQPINAPLIAAAQVIMQVGIGVPDV